MLSLIVRRRIKGLLVAGLTQVEAARITSVSLRSVKRIAKEPVTDSSDDAEERRRRGIGRPSKVSPYSGLIARLIAVEPEISSAGIMHRVQMAGYTGGRSALYALVAELRDRKYVVRRPLDGHYPLPPMPEGPYRKQSAR